MSWYRFLIRTLCVAIWFFLIGLFLYARPIPVLVPVPEAFPGAELAVPTPYVSGPCRKRFVACAILAISADSFHAGNLVEVIGFAQAIVNDLGCISYPTVPRDTPRLRPPAASADPSKVRALSLAWLPFSSYRLPLGWP